MEQEATGIRIDKWLWTLRMFKTRSLATEACKAGKVRCKDKTVKPSKEVFVGEEYKVTRNDIEHIWEVLGVTPKRVGAKMVDQYRKDNTPPEAFEVHKESLMNMPQRDRGAGRPTKRDRRIIEEVFGGYE